MAYYYKRTDELYHHGILGQKWGVRRFQNPDGSLTPAGKEREFYRRRVLEQRKHVYDLNAIVNTLSVKERKQLGATEKKWIDPSDAGQLSTIAKTFLQKNKDVPVSMLQIFDNGSKTGQIAIATSPNDRGSGATSKNIDLAIKWFNSKRNTRLDTLEWSNLIDNKKSGQIAEKHGFGDLKIDGDWEYRYLYKKR